MGFRCSQPVIESVLPEHNLTIEHSIFKDSYLLRRSGARVILVLRLLLLFRLLF